MKIADYEKLMCKGLQAPDPETGKDKEKKDDPANAVIDQGSPSIGPIEPSRPDASDPNFLKEGMTGFNETTPGTYGSDGKKTGNEQWKQMQKSLTVNTPWGPQSASVWQLGSTQFGKALIRTPEGSRYVDVVLKGAKIDDQEAKKEMKYENTPEDLMNKALGLPPMRKAEDKEEDDSPEALMKKAMTFGDDKLMGPGHEEPDEDEGMPFEKSFNPHLNSRGDGVRYANVVEKGDDLFGIPNHGSFDYTQVNVTPSGAMDQSQCGFDVYDRMAYLPK